MNVQGLTATISLKNNMTPVLNNIISTMNMVVNSANKVSGATEGMFAPGALDAAKRNLQEAQAQMALIGDATQEVELKQKAHNRELTKAQILAEGIKGKIMAMAGAYAGIRGVKMFVGASDELAQTKARLDSINTSFANSNEFMDAIYQSAKRSRGELMMTADVVAKLSMQAKDAFSNNQEAIEFAELLNKTFTLSGTDAAGVQSVMYNLTQAMASGVLRGQDLNAVMANAPMLVQKIADEMNVPVGKVRELAAEGKLSANVVKDALLNASGEINAEFNKMPMTFKQMVTSLKNEFIMAMAPAFEAFNRFINSKHFKAFADDAAIAARFIGDMLTFAIEGFLGLANMVLIAWEYLKIPILAVVTAIAVYNAQLLITKGLHLAATGITFLLATAHGILSIALGQTSFAQMALNNALFACPIVWILALIFGIIGGLVMLCKHIFFVGNTTFSVIGGIMGTAAVACTFIYNMFVRMVNGVIDDIIMMDNGFKRIGDSIARTMARTATNIKRTMAEAINWVLDKLRSAASMMDSIAGTNYAGSIDKVSAKVSDWGSRGYTWVKNERLDAAKLMGHKMQEKSMGDAYKKWYNKGANATKSLKDNMFGGANLKKQMEDLQKQNPLANQSSPSGGGGGKGGSRAAKDTAKNTKDIKKKLDDGIDIKNEDLKYLREIATARAIDQYSIGLDKVMVEVTNSFGDVHENVDLDGWQSGLVDGLTEAIHKSVGGGGLATT